MRCGNGRTVTMQIRYMERDEFIRLQREAEAEAAEEVEMRELQKQIQVLKEQLASAEA